MEYLSTITKIVNELFLYYLVIYATFLFLSVLVGALRMAKRQRMSQLHNVLKHDYYLPVSILVPAHNEEVTIVDTVLSLLQLHYKLYEIIVIDDGSSDGTAQVLIQRFHLQRINRPIHRRVPSLRETFVYESLAEKVPITLIQKKNGGKADALNMGINAARFPYFVSMDADSVLQDDALENIIKHVLADDTTVACGGMIRPANGSIFQKGRLVEFRFPNNIWAMLQIMEYDRSFLAARVLFDTFNGNLIISGAFGLFKKDVVIAAGGYNCDTLGEDMDLVTKLHVYCRLHHKPYTVQYASDAICWSQTPDNFRDLRKQRRRWYLGMFQTMLKHRWVLFNPRFGAIGSVSFLYYALYELFSPLIQVLGLVFIGLAYGLGLIYVHFMITFYVLCLLFGAILSITSFFTRMYTQHTKLSFKDSMKAILFCILENLGYRQILALFSATAFIGYKKNKLQWGKIKRSKIQYSVEETTRKEEL